MNKKVYNNRGNGPQEQLPVSWMKIPVFWRSLPNRKGHVLETAAFGHKITIITKIRPVLENDNVLYLIYDAVKATMQVNERGYFNLYINE